jgi:hypothetical protein
MYRIAPLLIVTGSSLGPVSELRVCRVVQESTTYEIRSDNDWLKTTLNGPSTRGDLYGSFQGYNGHSFLGFASRRPVMFTTFGDSKYLTNSAMSVPMECFRQSLQTSSVAVSEPTILSELGLHESEPGLTLCIA